MSISKPISCECCPLSIGFTIIKITGFYFDPDLACSEEEHCLVKLLLDVEDALVHIH